MSGLRSRAGWCQGFGGQMYCERAGGRARPCVRTFATIPGRRRGTPRPPRHGEPLRNCHRVATRAKFATLQSSHSDATMCSARGVGHAPAAAQPSRKSQPSSPDANPVQEVAGTVLRHDWVPLGPTERPPGARQTCFWALFQRSRPKEPLVARARGGRRCMHGGWPQSRTSTFR